MGIENFGKETQKHPFENIFADLENLEKVEKEKLRLIFQENAELSLMLAKDGEVDMTDHQKAYYFKALGKLRDETKESFQELRGVTGVEIPEELKGMRAADEYYKNIKKAA